jgi:hypothetical protein
MHIDPRLATVLAVILLVAGSDRHHERRVGRRALPDRDRHLDIAIRSTRAAGHDHTH